MQIHLPGLGFAKKINALCMPNRKREQIPQHTHAVILYTQESLFEVK